MDDVKIAQELVKMAKSLAAAGTPDEKEALARYRKGAQLISIAFKTFWKMYLDGLNDMMMARNDYEPLTDTKLVKNRDEMAVAVSELHGAIRKVFGDANRVR